MKTSRMTWLQSLIFAFLIGFSCVACMVSGFSLPVSLWTVALWCLLASLVFSFFCTRRLTLVAWGLWAVALILLWWTGALEEGVKALSYFLSQVYHDAFDWKLQSRDGRSLQSLQENAVTIFCLLGATISGVTAWSVAKGQSSAPVILAAIPLPLMCLLVNSSTPNLFWLWVLVFALTMVLLTASTRFDDEKRGNRLTLFTALPVMLAVILLFVAVPKDAYTGAQRAKAWSDALLEGTFLRDAWDDFTGQNQEKQYSKEIRTISLANLTARSEDDATVLTITPGFSGTVYLRSSAYDTYDGKNWVSSKEGNTLPWPSIQNYGESREMIISTQYAHAMLYTPYYTISMDLNDTVRGKENENRLTYYSITYAEMRDESSFENLYPNKAETNHIVGGDYGLQATSLPSRTKKWAQPLVDEITEGLGNSYHKAKAIRQYVSRSASYDLEPAMMPSGEKDFAQWFLEEGESGYCVHFATAATVLLKAAGIPARYITGYMVTAQAGVATAVTSTNAHAWVEYWLPGWGWTILDPTPPADSNYASNREKESDSSWRLDARILVAIGIGLAICLPVAIIAQWRIRLSKKLRRLKKGDEKQQVISRYGRLQDLHILLKEDIDPAVTALAEKAKFSPHPMTKADVAVLDCALDSAKGKLRRHNLWKQLYYRLFLAEL